MDTDIPPILLLPNKLLQSIFSYLDLSELFIAGSVCQRFEVIAQMFYKNCQSVDICHLDQGFDNKRHHPGLGGVLRQLEPHMIAMKVSDLSYEKIFCRPRFPISIFPNLQHLLLTNCEIHKDYANILPALKQIVLYNMSIRDESVLSCWFNNSPHLKILKFSYIRDMTGKCLVGLNGIEEIKIKYCINFQPKFFEQFCQLNPQLKKLSFGFGLYETIISNTFLEIISKYLKNLESLVILDHIGKGQPNYQILCNLPKVTKLYLDIEYDKQTSEYFHFLEYLATNNHIEYLNLGDATEGDLNILQQFPYLKVLKLGYVCGLKFGRIFNFLSCSTTLKELHIAYCYFESSARLKEFIEKFKSLRLLNVCATRTFNLSCLMDIEECLYKRSQLLEIVLRCTIRCVFPEELEKKIKSEPFKEFLERTKEKFKLTIGEFYSYRMPKKSFHECEEWEGLLPEFY